MWLGLLGMTRRMQHYDVAAWRPWLIVAAVGAVLILVGIVCQIMQLVVSIRDREELRDRTGDPWDGRSLEWATPRRRRFSTSRSCPTSTARMPIGT